MLAAIGAGTDDPKRVNPFRCVQSCITSSGSNWEEQRELQEFKAIPNLLLYQLYHRGSTLDSYHAAPQIETVLE